MARLVAADRGQSMVFPMLIINHAYLAFSSSLFLAFLTNVDRCSGESEAAALGAVILQEASETHLGLKIQFEYSLSRVGGGKTVGVSISSLQDKWQRERRQVTRVTMTYQGCRLNRSSAFLPPPKPYFLSSLPLSCSILPSLPKYLYLGCLRIVV